MKKILYIIIIVIVIIIVVILKYNHNFDNKDMLNNLSLIKARNDDRLSITINDIKETEDEYLVKYTVKANDSLYIFDSVKTAVNCNNDFKEILNNSQDMYIVLDYVPMYSCNPGSFEYQPSYKELLHLKAGDEAQYEIDLLKAHDNEVLTIEQLKSKKVFLVMGFLDDTAVNALEQQETDIKHYVENGKEYLSIRRPAVSVGYYNKVEIETLKK